MKNFALITINLLLVLGLLIILQTYFTDQNTIKAEIGKVDCLIKASSLEQSKFDKGNCYHIIQFKNLKI